MNRPLLLCHGHIEHALRMAEEANADAYLDDLISECQNVMDAYTRLIDAIDAAKSGAVDDVVAESKGYNRRAKVTHYDFTGRHVIREA